MRITGYLDGSDVAVVQPSVSEPRRILPPPPVSQTPPLSGLRGCKTFSSKMGPEGEVARRPVVKHSEFVDSWDVL